MNKMITIITKRKRKININLNSLKNDLAIFEGTPPHNSGSNHCKGDGYFAASLEGKYGLSIDELVEIRDKEIGKPVVKVTYKKKDNDET